MAHYRVQKLFAQNQRLSTMKMPTFWWILSVMSSPPHQALEETGRFKRHVLPPVEMGDLAFASHSPVCVVPLPQGTSTSHLIGMLQNWDPVHIHSHAGTVTSVCVVRRARSRISSVVQPTLGTPLSGRTGRLNPLLRPVHYYLLLDQDQNTIPRVAYVTRQHHLAQGCFRAACLELWTEPEIYSLAQSRLRSFTMRGAGVFFLDHCTSP